METLQRAANRGSVPTGYDIDNSLKLEDDNTENLYRNLNASTSTTKFTISMWAKRTEIGDSYLLYLRGVAGNESVVLRFATESASYPEALQVDIGAGGTNSRSYTKASFRDTSAWYHIVLAVDTTQSTATDRFKLYVNGVLETEYAVRNNPAEDFAMEVSSAKHRHGAYNDTDGFAGYCGYIAECHYIDGSQVAQTEFGEFDDDSGIWKPKAYSGSYGTGGYYLDFSNSSALGNNSAGDGTDFTLNNITSADQATDTPTNNFCTWNPLWAYQYQPTIKEGATVAAYGDSTDENAKATIGLTNGKWYWEAKPSGTIGSQFIGIATDGDSNISSGQGLTQNYQMTIEPQGRYYSYAGSLSESSAGQFTALTTSDTLGIALDMDSATQTIKYYANGSLILTRDLISEMQGRTVFPFLQNYESRTFNINFGGYTINTISSAASDENGYGTFEYAPPTGYYAICTKNLAEYG